MFVEENYVFFQIPFNCFTFETAVACDGMGEGVAADPTYSATRRATLCATLIVQHNPSHGATYSASLTTA